MKGLFKYDIDIIVSKEDVGYGCRIIAMDWDVAIAEIKICSSFGTEAACVKYVGNFLRANGKKGFKIIKTGN